MRADVPELLFPSRSDFRAWLAENAETSEGVWLVFSKSKVLKTLSANDALEEALAFGWVDGLCGGSTKRNTTSISLAAAPKAFGRIRTEKLLLNFAKKGS